MDDQTFTRRAVLKQSLQIPAAGTALWALAACDSSNTPKAIVCADPNALSVAENSLRKAGHYEEKAPDPTKNCSGCGFFKAGESGPCGKCEIFQGPVNSGGHCDSWAAKAA